MSSLPWFPAAAQRAARAVLHVVAIAVAVGGGTGVAPAQGPDPQPTWRVFDLTADAHLDGDVAFHFDFAPDGIVWIASSNGLLRYDGYRWERFGTADGLPSNYVRCVRMTRAGELWVGTDAGAGVFDGRTFDRRDATTPLAGRSIRRIVEDDDGTLWFCCDHWPPPAVQGGLTRRRAGQWRTFGVDDGLPSDYVSDFYRDSTGVAYVLTRKGVAQLEGDQFTMPLRAAGLEGAEDYAWSIAEAGGVGLSIATEQAFFRRDEVGWHRVPVPGGRGLVRLAATADATLLACFHDGRNRFERFDGRELRAATRSLGGRDWRVEHLAEAPDGSVWASGPGLLLRWERRGGKWALVQGVGRPELRDRSGRVWFVDASGSRYRDGDRWRPVPGMHAPLVETVDGRIWGRGSDGLVGWSNGERLVVTARELGMVEVHGAAVDGAGGLWCRGRRRDGRIVLACRTGARWVTRSVGAAGWRISATTADPVDGLHVVMVDANGDRFALYKVSRSAVREIELPDVAGLQATPRVLPDGDGDLWLYGLFGAYRLGRNGVWEPVAGLPGRHVTGVFSCADRLWFVCRNTTGGTNGLAQLQNGEWTRFEVSAGHHVGSDDQCNHLLTIGDDRLCMVTGIGDLRVMRLPLHTTVRRVLVEPDGAQWVDTVDGLLRYHPDGISPRAFLTASGRRLVEGEELRVSVDARQAFVPTARAGPFRVATRVDDTAWSPFRELTERGIAISGLTVGEHRLSVRVMDGDGDVSAAPEILELSVEPPPLQSQWWFWAILGSGLAVLCLFGGIALRSGAVRRELHERLRAQSRYRTLVETSPYGICEIDAGGRLVSLNEAAADALGLDDRATAGSARLVDTVDEADRERVLEGIARALHGETDELEFRGSAGNLIHGTLSPLPEDAPVKTGATVIVHDVTENRSLETRLRHAHKMEAIGRLAGGVAHDFNNLLTAVLGNVELLRCIVDDGAEGTDAFHDGLAQIERAGQRAASLTQQLLTFGRRDRVRAEVLDPSALLSTAQALLQPVLAKDVELCIEAPTESWNIRADAGQLELLILNLAINANDAMAENGGRLTLTVRDQTLDARRAEELGAPAPGDYVKLRVADTGMGMSLDVRDRALEPFFTTKPEGRGTGLGLATVHGIVTGSRGFLGLESTEGEGTTVDVYLPRAEGVVIIPAPTTGESTATPGGDETVLVCEDQAMVRQFVCAALRNAGYEVLSAGNGEEALRLESTCGVPIHLLVTDLVMPGMSGRALAAEMQRRRPDLRVLLMSGYEALSDGQRGIRVADEDRLGKPFSGADLLHAARVALDRSSAALDVSPGDTSHPPAAPPA